jgi:hypothetical protein
MPVIVMPPFGFRPPFGTLGVGHNLSDISIPSRLREVALQHPPAIGVDFNLKYCLDPAPREAQVEASDAAE